MKVAELTGALLDYWVAKAEGFVWSDGAQFWDAPASWSPGLATPEDNSLRFYCYRKDEWKPSTNWAQGGPIIEREIAQLEHSSNDPGLVWNATNDDGDVYWGDTALIAAMRAYVASKLGDTVPDEVTP